MKVLRNLMLCVTLFSALIAPSLTYAQFVNGNTLKDWAEGYDRLQRRKPAPEPEEVGAANRLTGFVAAIYDSLNSGQLWCITGDEVLLNQPVAVVAKYVQEHPETWNGPAFAIVIVALQEAFPCPDSNP